MAEAFYPPELLYHPEHDWARLDGDVATFGITWHAQDALGEVVFFDPPKVGAQLTQHEPYTEVESVKAVSDVIAPLSGEMIEINELLAEKPEAINEDPTAMAGWSRSGLPTERSERAARARRLRRHARRMSRYTAVTDADRAAMLEAIGVASVDELFGEIPEGVACNRRSSCPTGLGEAEVYAHLRSLAARNTSHRGRDFVSSAPVCTTTTCPRHRHADGALGVPDALHALSAGDLPGRPAGDVRIPDGDLRADRDGRFERLGLRGPVGACRRRLSREAHQRPPAPRHLARRPSARERDAPHAFAPATG
jgi:glycine cleavage system H protein